ncbi:MAG: hypothetical protein AB7F83_00160 [Lysobacterales bacterium]
MIETNPMAFRIKHSGKSVAARRATPINACAGWAESARGIVRRPARTPMCGSQRSQANALAVMTG